MEPIELEQLVSLVPMGSDGLVLVFKVEKTDYFFILHTKPFLSYYIQHPWKIYGVMTDHSRALVPPDVLAAMDQRIEEFLDFKVA